jgi:hypothetical protein
MALESARGRLPEPKQRALRPVSPPKAFYLTIGGYPTGYSAVLWRRGVLRYMPPMSRLRDANNRLLVPSAEEVRWFAQRLRRIGVYAWERRYEFPDICDGTGWSLRINWPGQGRVRSDGSNASPERFRSLVRAVRQLTHGMFDE